MMRFTLCLFFVSSASFGDTVRSGNFDQTIWESSQVFSIPHCVLYAMLLNEGGTEGEDVVHPNGAIDTGIAQINKGGAWMVHLQEKFGVTYEQLRDNGHLAILYSAYILRSEMDRVMGDPIAGLSAYNRGAQKWNDDIGVRYAARAIEHMSVLTREGICKSKYEADLRHLQSHALNINALQLSSD